MARMMRLKNTSVATWYHLHARIAGRKGEYPLADPLAQRKLIETIRRYAAVYFCEVAAFAVMGNHYHLVLQFEAEREVDSTALMARASVMYPGKMGRQWLASWGEAEWERYRKRLFDVSEFMRNVQSGFARWYNRTNERRGRFWGDRFKSVVLGDERAVLDCVLYVELNAVRAGLVERPEAWEGASVFLREIGEDGWLVPLESLLNVPDRGEALVQFRQRLYHRGAVPTREGQAAISGEVLREEAARGFRARGVYRRRLSYFVNGLAIGTEGFIREQLAQLRESGVWPGWKNPVPQLGGVHHTVRRQRTTER
jgi:REP element-mobilizing transposase RayT